MNQSVKGDQLNDDPCEENKMMQQDEHKVDDVSAISKREFDTQTKIDKAICTFLGILNIKNLSNQC
eukprot:403376086